MKRSTSPAIALLLATMSVPTIRAIAQPFVWVIEDVDTTLTAGNYCSLEFDSQGRPSIAYRGPDKESLYFAVRENGAWQVGPVELGIELTGINLVYDDQGEPAIVFHKLGAFSGGDIVIARRNANEWSQQIVAEDIPGASIPVPSEAGQWTIGLTRTPSGSLAVSYGDGDFLYYAEESDEGWASEIVGESGSPFWMSLLEWHVDDYPVITHFAMSSNAYKHVTASTRIEGIWMTDTNDLPGSYCYGNYGMAIAPDGKVAVSSTLANQAAAIVALRNTNGNWTYLIADSGSDPCFGYNSSVAFAQDGTLYHAYVWGGFIAEPNLSVAWRRGGDSGTQVVAYPAGDFIGETSIAMRPNDAPAVSYHNSEWLSFAEAHVLGDTDDNGSVELPDLGGLLDCLKGPGHQAQGDCAFHDFDFDDDVDLANIAAWMTAVE